MIGALGRAVASDWPKVIAARTRRTSVTAPAYGLPLYQPPRRLLTVANPQGILGLEDYVGSRSHTASSRSKKSR